jgi:hypothetical protein
MTEWEPSDPLVVGRIQDAVQRGAHAVRDRPYRGAGRPLGFAQPFVAYLSAPENSTDVTASSPATQAS